MTDTESPIPSGSWAFWYMNKPANRGHLAASNYEAHIHRLLMVDSLPGLCSALSHLSMPSAVRVRGGTEHTSSTATSGAGQDQTAAAQELPPNTDLHFFRAGIKPTWEDPGNVGGGRFIVRLRKGVCARMFEWLVLSLAGASDSPWATTVCGVVLSPRFTDDCLAVWVGSAAVGNEFALGAVRERLRGALQLPPAHPIEFKAHDTAGRK